MKKLSIVLYLTFLVFGFSSMVGAAGEVDPTFPAGAYGIAGGNVFVVRNLPDGKILIGGSFTSVQGYAATSVARLNSDGSVDTTFTAPGFTGTFGLGGPIYSIEVLSDGKILVGGSIFGTAPGENLPGLRRLNADGSVDQTFNVVPLDGNREIRDISVLPDGKILIAGAFHIVATFPNNRGIARLNSDGTLDTSFTGSAGGARVYDIQVLPDGKVVAVGASVSQSIPIVAKFEANGTLDPAFSQTGSGSGEVFTVAALSDGKLLIGGSYTMLGSTQQGRISRLNSNGTIDPAFNQSMSGAEGTITDLVVRTDGKINIAGGFTSYNGTAVQRLARLNADGGLDNTFAVTNFGTSGINDIEMLPDQRIIAGLSAPAGSASVMRFSADGVHDTALHVNTAAGGTVRKILQQPDGKVLAGGSFLLANNTLRRSLVRFNADGSIDTSFVPYFNTTAPNTVVLSVALQPDGKILVGTNNGIALVRLNPDGSQDTSFTSALDGSSAIHDIAVLSDGRIVVGGITNAPSYANRVARLLSNGALDTTFTPPAPNHVVYRVLVQPDGKYLISGEFFGLAGGIVRGRIARLNTDGSNDATFNPGGAAAGADSTINDLELQPDGKILVGGAFASLNGNTSIRSIGRLNPDGSLDGSFVQTTNSSVLGLRLQPDGRVLIVGQFSVVGASVRFAIARLHPNGSVDLSFAPSANSIVWDVQQQLDGKVLIAGQFTKINGVSALGVARLLNVSVPQSELFDYDGDGRADVSVFRPSENKWYIFRSSDSVVYQPIFAIGGDVPAPADYDGDGKTDVAIFRPSSGDWWYLATTDGTQRSVHWGANGDIPRPSDFDNDGKADFIVYRPSNSVWYRFGSTGATSIVAFGLAGDKPVTGDFDGDGRTDPAIFRPSTGTWWYLSSVSGAQVATQFGVSTDIPTAADFDGDGRTDLAVFRPSNGGWYILNSSTGQATVVAFGLSEDKPVAADYDGDGRADIAVFRPSTGIWYLLRSASGFTAMQFGVATDTPTPNAFIP